MTRRQPFLSQERSWFGSLGCGFRPHHANGQAPVTAAPAATPAQAPVATTEFHFPTPEERAAINAASTAERDRELKLLGITDMQPGATAYDIGKPGNANYDESKANPYPNLPPLLVMNNGTKVKTPAQWAKRRKEIQAAFDEDVYGKYPEHIPAVTWTVANTQQMTIRACRPSSSTSLGVSIIRAIPPLRSR